jgi:hypothetical protein
MVTSTAMGIVRNERVSGPPSHRTLYRLAHFTAPALAEYAPVHTIRSLAMVGQFLLKDVLLGAPPCITGESWLAASNRKSLRALN